jgi:hypothetical protein
MDNAFEWLLQAHSGTIVTEASYPYVSGEGQVPACSMSGTTPGATISSHKDLAHDETQMAAFVYSSGPLSIAVDATSWQTYISGIMTNCISVQIDHGVLIVGFDSTNTPPYWIVKNSWGKSWGEEGYIRIESGSNQCLITSDPCTSIVSGGTPAPGPSPPGPTPPTPPSPSGDFEQKHCKDPKCKDCKAVRLPQDHCITGAKNSYKAKCISDGLLVTTFSTRDCKGVSTETVNPVDVCSIIFDSAREEEFVLNSCHAGPAPPGPTTQPPNPPGPTPTPSSNGSFTQKQCQDANCTQCNSNTFPQNQCLQLSDGGSGIAVCQASGLLLTEYPLSSTCTGPSIPDLMPINQCLQDEDGTYFENICSSSSLDFSAKKLRLTKQLSRKVKHFLNHKRA